MQESDTEGSVSAALRATQNAAGHRVAEDLSHHPTSRPSSAVDSPCHYRLSGVLESGVMPSSVKSANAAATDAATAGRVAMPPLYTPEERRRRDASPWTIVQGILAPLQFVVFLVSLALVLRFLATGEGYVAATVSVVVKTLVLYVIMVTGAVWEKVVFGKYLFARAFFWEDVFSMLVLALHTAYLVALAVGAAVETQMVLALAAYATYVINATQFVLKLRAARRQQRDEAASELVGAAS